MMLVIILSIIQLCFKTEYLDFQIIDKVALVAFIIYYLLRWLTADLKLKKEWVSFVIYPFIFMAILNFVCIFTVFSFVDNTFKALKMFRLIKTIRYSKSIKMMKTVFIEQKKSLITVWMVAIVYIIFSAIVIFNA